MAASATAIRQRGISMTTRGVRRQGNTFVADDSCGGAKNWWKGNVWRVKGVEGRARKSTCSFQRKGRIIRVHHGRRRNCHPRQGYFRDHMGSVMSRKYLCSSRQLWRRDELVDSAEVLIPCTQNSWEKWFCYITKRNYGTNLYQDLHRFSRWRRASDHIR